MRVLENFCGKKKVEIINNQQQYLFGKIRGESVCVYVWERKKAKKEMAKMKKKWKISF